MREKIIVEGEKMSTLKRFRPWIVILLLGVCLLAGCTSPKQDGGKQPGTQTEGNPPASDSNNVNPEQKEDAQKTLLNEIMRLARQGKIINCNFPVETTVIGTVKEQWGEPDKDEYIFTAKGSYATYTKRDVVFGYNKGCQIFDVRSYAENIKRLSMNKVKEILGTPTNTHTYDTEEMLVYQAGEKYQLLFLFPKATQQNPNPNLDHYNVFYPRGTVNMMAGDPGIKY